MKTSGEREGIKIRRKITGRRHGTDRDGGRVKTQGEEGVPVYTKRSRRVEVSVWEMWQPCLFNMYTLLSSPGGWRVSERSATVCSSAHSFHVVASRRLSLSLSLSLSPLPDFLSASLTAAPGCCSRRRHGDEDADPHPHPLHAAHTCLSSKHDWTNVACQGANTQQARGYRQDRDVMLIIRSEMCSYCTMSRVLWQVCFVWAHIKQLLRGKVASPYWSIRLIRSRRRRATGQDVGWFPRIDVNFMALDRQR